jgi:hypothetical protein
MSDRMDENHGEARSALRTVGPIVAGVGGLLVLVGMVSFFSAFGGFGPPKHFWCAFLGMPILGVGIVLTKLGYMGRIARYMANEVAPVGKDTFNYMARGMRGSVQDLAAAVGAGLREGQQGPSSADDRGIACAKCGEQNDPTANFCKSCGLSIQSAAVCSACGDKNDADARFCDNCGKAL